VLSKLLGRTITYRYLSFNEDRDAMIRAGVPAPVAEMNAQAFTLIAGGDAGALGPFAVDEPERRHEDDRYHRQVDKEHPPPAHLGREHAAEEHSGSARYGAHTTPGAKRLDLWVPRTSSTSCDQAVFVDHAADTRVSSDSVLRKIYRFG
jgi:hypothetical protein